MFDELPEVVAEAWKAAGQLPAGERRHAQTAIINNAFVRDGDKLQLTTTHPLFTEYKRRVDQKYFRREAAGFHIWIASRLYKQCFDRMHIASL